MITYKSKQYRGIHNWIERRLGKPKVCEICDDISRSVYHWANISGNYLKDIRDWRRLCVPCHSAENKITHCKRGHLRNSDNLNAQRACKECVRFLKRGYYHRMKLV